MSNSPRKMRRSERGTALIEFALVLPFLLVLTLTVIDFTRAFYTKNMLHTAVREGVRLLAVSSAADSANVQDRVQYVASTLGSLDNVRVQVSGPDAAKLVRVDAEADFTWLYPGLFSFLGITVDQPTVLAASAVMHDE